jgi:DNA repair protein RecN (Recombination protein N)
MLKSLGLMLVNVHGQHDSQNLLNESTHISYLDGFADNFEKLERINRNMRT